MLKEVRATLVLSLQDRRTAEFPPRDRQCCRVIPFSTRAAMLNSTDVLILMVWGRWHQPLRSSHSGHIVATKLAVAASHFAANQDTHSAATESTNKANHHDAPRTLHISDRAIGARALGPPAVECARRKCRPLMQELDPAPRIAMLPLAGALGGRVGGLDRSMLSLAGALSGWLGGRVGRMATVTGLSTPQVCELRRNTRTRVGVRESFEPQRVGPSRQTN